MKSTNVSLKSKAEFRRRVVAGYKYTLPGDDAIIHFDPSFNNPFRIGFNSFTHDKWTHFNNLTELEE